MKLSRLFAGALIAVLSLFVSVSAMDMGSHGDIMIDSPWARASAPGSPSAGYLMIHNHGDMDDTLLSVSGDFGKRLEVHRSFEEDGIMRMVHQVEGVVIPANGMLTLEPGGYHLMFMGLNKNFVEGETYSVVLTFEHAGEIKVDLEVKDMAKMSGMKMSH